jgi:hypothetical protein
VSFVGLIKLPSYIKEETLFELSRYSSVGTATGYRLDGPGSIPGSAIFISSPEALSPVVKR